MRTIAVFGASGRTGKQFTELALKNEYAVKALVRNVSRLGTQHSNLQVIQGDALNPIDVKQTIDETEAVIDLIGPGKGKGSPPELQRTATRSILDAMRQQHVKRIVVLASLPFGILDPRDRPSFIHKSMMFMAKRLMGAMVQDAREHIQWIIQTELDWTVVRAPSLNDEPLRGNYRVGYLDAKTGKSIARSDVAAFMLDVLMNNKYVRQMPLLSN